MQILHLINFPAFWLTSTSKFVHVTNAKRVPGSQPSLMLPPRPTRTCSRLPLDKTIFQEHRILLPFPYAKYFFNYLVCVLDKCQMKVKDSCFPDIDLFSKFDFWTTFHLHRIDIFSMPNLKFRNSTRITISNQVLNKNKQATR